MTDERRKREGERRITAKRLSIFAASSPSSAGEERHDSNERVEKQTGKKLVDVSLSARLSLNGGNQIRNYAS